jgi:sec-independent protein translocase protein TatA
MGALSIHHWLIVLLVVLLLFGAGRLGEVGKGLGDGIRNFKKGLGGEDDPGPEPRGEKAGARPEGETRKPPMAEAGSGSRDGHAG